MEPQGLLTENQQLLIFLTIRKLMKRFGERGRNRTSTYCFSISNPQINGFNGFPSTFVVTSRQIYARLFPSVLPSFEWSAFFGVSAKVCASSRIAIDREQAGGNDRGCFLLASFKRRLPAVPGIPAQRPPAGST